MSQKSARNPPKNSTSSGGIDSALDEAKLQTRIVRVPLAELRLVEKNARYMEGRQFTKLVANIRRDGCLTTLPLVHREGEHLTVISGNHRVQAAIKAGLLDSDVIEVTSPLTRKQFVALQLSHNAIVGVDDQSVLKSLYDELDFDWKEYSGLTDEAFDMRALDVSVLHVDAPFFEELTITFLPTDRDIFTGWLEKLSKSKEALHMVGRYEDFGHFFDTLLAVKSVKGVHNTAVALRLMADLAGRALAEEAEASHAGT